MRYRIHNESTGADLGEFDAETEAEALDKMAAKSGLPAVTNFQELKDAWGEYTGSFKVTAVPMTTHELVSHEALDYSHLGDHNHFNTDKADVALDALADAFSWSDSPEGNDFWEDVYDRLAEIYYQNKED